MPQVAPQITDAVIQVTRKDLPVCCPGRDTGSAEMHPRVYLPVRKDRVVTCPYCSARYQLVD
jgi:uncharacterized Zn-finger protein